MISQPVQFSFPKPVHQERRIAGGRKLNTGFLWSLSVFYAAPGWLRDSSSQAAQESALTRLSYPLAFTPSFRLHRSGWKTGSWEAEKKLQFPAAA